MPNSQNTVEEKTSSEIPVDLAFVLAELDDAASTIETHFAGLHPAREIPDHLRRTFDRLTRVLYRG